MVEADARTKLKQSTFENKSHPFTECEYYILAALQVSLKHFKSTLPVQNQNWCVAVFIKLLRKPGRENNLQGFQDGS
jgi:hypothetical protein